MPVARLINFAGGRRIRNDDLRAIQATLDGLRDGFGSLRPPFVVQGCQVQGPPDNLSLSPGVVLMADNLFRNRLVTVPQITGIDTTQGRMLRIAISSNTFSQRLFSLLSLNQPCLEEATVEVVSSAFPAQTGPGLIITPAGLRNMQDALREVVYKPGQMTMLATNQVNQFDAQGRGLGSWRGWRRMTLPGASINMANAIPVGIGALNFGDTNQIEGQFDNQAQEVRPVEFLEWEGTYQTLVRS